MGNALKKQTKGDEKRNIHSPGELSEVLEGTHGPLGRDKGLKVREQH